MAGRAFPYLRMRSFFLFFALSAAALLALAQTPSGNTISVFDKEIPRKADKELQFFAYFFSQGVSGNYYPTNDFLRGQVVGRLFGGNTATTSDSLNTHYFEQRLLPFFIYQPKLLGGKAVLRTSFEIDWTWGDVAYSTGGNFGSAVAADAVNIQTQNVELELIPKKGWAINLGLQRMFDTPYNPYRTVFDKMTTSAYRLMYWGTDGVGISVRHDRDFGRWKAGFYQLYENNIEQNDDVQLFEWIGDKMITPRFHAGASVYYVKDRANGEGGPSILGQGLNATLLNNYNGTYRFPYGASKYKADIVWTGLNFGYNDDWMMGRVMVSGFVNANLGKTHLREQDTADWRPTTRIAGVGANLRLGYRYGQTANDIAVADLLYSTGDENGISDSTYSGVITGNTWGAPGGIFISHGGYIIFPNGNVVNRFISAVSDFSNLGYGLTGGTVNLYHDFIPHKLNFKAGGAAAWANAAPNGGGKTVGYEVNGRISWQPAVFMNVELHGAYAWLGNFYDTATTVNAYTGTRPTNPWTVFLVYKWLLF